MAPRFSQAMDLLPEGLRALVAQGIHDVAPERVYLFGSRARGEARADSDYDLAFVFDPSRDVAWARFLSDAAESPLTLQRVDWVNLREASRELKARVLSEGKVIYEKAKADS